MFDCLFKKKKGGGIIVKKECCVRRCDNTALTPPTLQTLATQDRPWFLGRLWLSIWRKKKKKERGEPKDSREESAMLSEKKQQKKKKKQETRRESKRGVWQRYKGVNTNAGELPTLRLNGEQKNLCGIASCAPATFFYLLTFFFFCCYMCMSGNCTEVVSFLKCEMADVQVWCEPLRKFLYPPHFDSKILAKCQRSRRERQQVAASFFFSPLFNLGNTCALTTTCKPKVHEQEKKKHWTQNSKSAIKSNEHISNCRARHYLLADEKKKRKKKKRWILIAAVGNDPPFTQCGMTTMQLFWW